jgi:hypothetical protein
MVIRVLAVPDSLALPSFDEVFRSILGWCRAVGVWGATEPKTRCLSPLPFGHDKTRIEGHNSSHYGAIVRMSFSVNAIVE